MYTVASKIGEQSALSYSSSRRLVLVVEAAPRFVADLTEQLTSLGYQFAIARSGTEALEKARRLQPKVVLLNPLLPLLSGWDVLTLLKSDAVTSRIPVIVTATRAEREQAFLNRADDFLSLPVQQQSLQALVERFCQQSSPQLGIAEHRQSLTILHLVNSHSSIPFAQDDLQATSLLLGDRSHSTFNYRVLEADDLEQAELIARLWQPNVVLIAAKTSDPITYIKQLCQYPNLKSLPLVTLEVAIAQAAQVAGLSAFPYLTTEPNYSIDTLLPVLKIAAGLDDKPNLLLVDVATLADLPDGSPTSEWFQALIQYFKIAGFTAIIGSSWAQVLQQLRQQSVDLLLICLNESKLHPNTLAALKDLSQQHNLPPVVVLDWMNRGEVRPMYFNIEESVSESIDKRSVSDPINQEILRAIATQILPGSISIEQLLVEVNQTLVQGKGNRREST